MDDSEKLSETESGEEFFYIENKQDKKEENIQEVKQINANKYLLIFIGIHNTY